MGVRSTRSKCATAIANLVLAATLVGWASSGVTADLPVPPVLPLHTDALPVAPSCDESGSLVSAAYCSQQATTTASCSKDDPCDLTVGYVGGPEHVIQALQLTWNDADIDWGEQWDYVLSERWSDGTTHVFLHVFCERSPSTGDDDCREIVHATTYRGDNWSLHSQSRNEGNQWPEGHVGWVVSYDP